MAKVTYHSRMTQVQFSTGAVIPPYALRFYLVD
jgi:hypothetical protein